MIDTAPKEITDLTETIFDETVILFDAKDKRLTKEERECMQLFIPLFNKRIDKLIQLLEEYWSKKN